MCWDGNEPCKELPILPDELFHVIDISELFTYPFLPVIAFAKGLCRFWIQRLWKNIAIDQSRDTIVRDELAFLEVICFWLQGLYLRHYERDQMSN